MSDGFTDGTHAAVSKRKYDRFLKVLTKYLGTTPNSRLFNKLITEAQEARVMQYVYWTWLDDGSTFLESFKRRLQPLVDKNRTEWARFLVELSREGLSAFAGLKEISPFAGQILVSVNSRCGQSSITGEIESYLFEVLSQIGGQREMVGGRCVIFLPPFTSEGLEVVRL